MQLLKRNNITFDSFDILEDEEVRAGIKVFSNWPTFPQVYVKGTLIGGLDILTEMEEDDELKDAFDVSDVTTATAPLPLDERIKALLNRSKMILFMKG